MGMAWEGRKDKGIGEGYNEENLKFSLPKAMQW